jgi:hypothetical protein
MQKGTRVQFRLRTLLWGTVWISLLLGVCVRQQHAATRHRQALEARRASGFFRSPRLVPSAAQQPAASTVTRQNTSAPNTSAH